MKEVIQEILYGLLGLHFYEAASEMEARNADNLYQRYQLFNFSTIFTAMTIEKINDMRSRLGGLRRFL